MLPTSYGMLRHMQAFSQSETGFSAGLVADQVRRFYERHQYPNYPLLAKPRWQEGYLTSSLFSAALLGKTTNPLQQKILIAGAGEILPYIIRKWQPRSHHVIALDGSASSLRRAQLRCWRTTKPVQFVAADLDEYLQANGSARFDHVDAFGVLHHLPNPTKTLQELAHHLAPGGTMRVMVYNAAGRSWIRQIQCIFRSFSVDYMVSNDIKWAQTFLSSLAALTPALAAKLRQMGPSLLQNPARFADTFLHPREAQIPLVKWMAAAKKGGLRLRGVYDRYGELDEYPNPLWRPPPLISLAKLAIHGLFQGNWEMFFEKIGEPTQEKSRSRQESLPLNLLAHSSPALWWSFPETENVSGVQRGQLWSHFLWHLHRPSNAVTKRSLLYWIKRQPFGTAQRLARLGAILPGMIEHAATKKMLLAPLPPSYPAEVLSGELPPQKKQGRMLFSTEQKNLIERSRDQRKISKGRLDAIGARIRVLNALKYSD